MSARKVNEGEEKERRQKGNEQVKVRSKSNQRTSQARRQVRANSKSKTN